MGKKGQTESVETTAADVAAMALEPRLQAVLASLTAEERTGILALSSEEQIEQLEMIASIEASATMGGDVAFVSAKPTQENILILTAGGPGLRAGTTIRGYLMGIVHVFAKEMKENWKEFKGKKQVFFYNSYFKFKDANGKEFGIWNSPALRNLEKIPTHAATPALVGKNPLVEIKYVGKIEGKEVLKQQYGLELTKGNAAHVFIPKVEDGVRFNAYVKGAVNSLNSPVPVESEEEAGTVTREDATRSNYERLMQLQAQAEGGSSVAGLLS